MNATLWFVLILMVLIVLGAIWAYFDEVKKYNKGTCAKSGKPWYQFDTDSAGSAMLTDGEGNFLIISWTHMITGTR